MSAIRVALRVATVRVVRRGLGRLGSWPAPTKPCAGAEDVVRAVRRAAAAMPGTSCLVEALAIEALLARRGVPSTLRIGFERRGDGALGGHAWIEANGMTLGAAGGATWHARATAPRARSA